MSDSRYGRLTHAHQLQAIMLAPTQSNVALAAPSEGTARTELAADPALSAAFAG